MSRQYTQRHQIAILVVKKAHLLKLFELFRKRFSFSSDVKITISFDIESESFSRFEDFDSCIKKEALGLKKNIQDIEITGIEGLSMDAYKSAKVTISFNSDNVAVFITGRGTQEIGDWVQGFHKDMDVLFKSFQPNENLIKYIKNSDKERYKYRSSVIAFDYNNTLEETVGEKEENNKSTWVCTSRPQEYMSK